MSTRLTSAFLVCLLLVTLMEEAKPVLGGKGGGKFSKLSNRVKGTGGEHGGTRRMQRR